MRTAQTSGRLLILVLATSLGVRADAPKLGWPVPAYEPFQGGVRGTVTSQQTGQPVTDAAVLLQGKRPDRQDRRTTDRKGEYRSGPLRKGTNRLHGIDKGQEREDDFPMLGWPVPPYEPFQGGVRGTVTSQQTEVPAYEPFQGGVRGTVTSQQTGQPVTDAAVLLEGEWPNLQELSTTDRKGEYRSGPLREGTYRLRCIRGQTISEHTVQIQKQQTLTLNVVLPPEPPRPVDKGQPADYDSWLPCKIVDTVPDSDGMILMIDRGSKQHLGPSMEGVVLKGDVLQPIEGGGRFKLFKIVDGRLSVGLLSSYWPQVKNHACRINARSF